MAGLLAAMVAAGSPILLAPIALAVMGLAVIAGRGHRLRLAWVALGPLVLFAPLVWSLVQGGSWRQLLADPGAALGYEPAPYWLQLLGWPAGPQLPGFVPSALVTPLAVVMVGGAALAALAALCRPGSSVKAVRFGWFVALLGAVTLLGADRIVVSYDGLQGIRPWTGPACLLVLLGLLLAAAAGASGIVGDKQASRGGRSWRLGTAAVAVTVLLIGPLLGGAWGVWQRWELSDVRRLSELPVASIAAAEASGQFGTYTLTIQNVAGALEWEVIRGAGRQNSDPEGLLGARQVDGWPGQATGPDAAAQAMNAAVAAMAARNAGASSLDLASWGIGFVTVPAADAALAAAMDATPGLSRVTDSDSRIVWRVSPADLEIDGRTCDWAGRLHVVDRGQAVALASGAGTTIRTDLPDGGEGRRLILAERADPGWRATLNGRALKAVAGDGWYQEFELPAGSGRLKIWHPEHWWLGLGQAAGLILALLVALPIRRGATIREES
jgi:hypothetical protein